VRRALSTTLLIALAVAAGACGGKHNGLSDAAQRQLNAMVGQVRAAADAREVAGADRVLAELRRAVHSYQQNGDLSSARASEILDAATLVQARLALVTTTTTTTTTLPPSSNEEHDHGKHRGRDKGQGNQGNQGD
jgi:hypothetical protein